MREQTRAAMDRILAGVSSAHDGGYELEYVPGYDSVVNDPELAAYATTRLPLAPATASARASACRSPSLRPASRSTSARACASSISSRGV